MFVQVLIEEEEEKNAEKGKNAHLKRFIWFFFFLSGAYDRYKIVESNRERKKNRAEDSWFLLV